MGRPSQDKNWLTSPSFEKNACTTMTTEAAGSTSGYMKSERKKLAPRNRSNSSSASTKETSIKSGTPMRIKRKVLKAASRNAALPKISM